MLSMCAEEDARLLTPGAMADSIVSESPSLGNMFLENNIPKKHNISLDFSGLKTGLDQKGFLHNSETFWN